MTPWPVRHLLVAPGPAGEPRRGLAFRPPVVRVLDVLLPELKGAIDLEAVAAAGGLALILALWSEGGHIAACLSSLVRLL